MTLREESGSLQLRIAMSCTTVALAALLAGCGPSDTGLQPAAARQLQARVLEVSEASSRNDPAAALTALDGLEAGLAAAEGKGQISAERRQTIKTIAAAVRADLDEAVASAATAAADAKVSADQAVAQASPPSTGTPAPAPEPAPAPAPETGNNGDKKDNEGKGKAKD